MKVGIIGKGKMGLDLYNVLLEYDHSIVLICRNENDIEPLVQKTNKLLSRKLKRQEITEEEYKMKLHSNNISTCYEDLRECDIVFETVIEDIDAKHDVLRSVESEVDEHCVIATNTSSFDVDRVFEEMKNKGRCLGVHFFYPIKIIRTAEINVSEETEEKYIISTNKFLETIGRKVMILKQDGKLIFSKMLATIVALSYLLYDKGILNIDEINSLTKKQFMMFGAFEVIDSTGLQIIINCLKNFSNDRYREIYTPLCNAASELFEKGYYGGKNSTGFLEAQKNGVIDVKDIQEDISSRREKALLLLKAIFLNELAYMVNNHLVGDVDFLNIVKNTLGLLKNPKMMFDEIGEEKIYNILMTEYENSKCFFFKPEDYSIYKNKEQS